MTGRLAGKLALVTGAAQGIGAAIAMALARHGAKVMLTDVNAENLEHTAAAISADVGEGRVASCLLDVTDEGQWIAALDRMKAVFGGLSILVNNAGSVMVGGVEDLSLDQWRSGTAINVDSVFLGCKHALPMLRASQPASIVNISSIAGLIASHNFANYNATKAAVWLLSKSIALDCARKGDQIRCNSIHPSFIRTPILNDLVPKGTDVDAVMSKLIRQIPAGRLGEAEEVAEAVVFLASDESLFVTASELKIDGGISAM
jgi:NAD(P)-dependent dehydrogenase (short-subunit alcohol dehydrogenase family)